jgi:hypothetical protein
MSARTTLPSVSVLLPTHDHADTILRAIASAQAQTVPVLEILVVGDGVPDRTRALMAELTRKDPRVRFFDFEKGPRNGEIHRHPVMAEARGEVVLTLCDDDLWLPRHVETLAPLLMGTDLAHVLPVIVYADQSIGAWHFDLGRLSDRELMRRGATGFGLATGGYRVDAYRRLPHGWRTTPAGMPTDLHMWNQFVEQPWCRVASSSTVSVLHFGAPHRRDWSLERRCAELDDWLARTARPGIYAELETAAIAALGRLYGPLTPHLFVDAEPLAAVIEERALLRSETAALRDIVARLSSPLWRRVLRRARRALRRPARGA